MCVQLIDGDMMIQGVLYFSKTFRLRFLTFEIRVGECFEELNEKKNVDDLCVKNRNYRVLKKKSIKQ